MLASPDELPTPRQPEMSTYHPSPSEAVAYKLGQLQDPGTSGDKRQIYETAKNQANALSLIPPVGAAWGAMDLGHAYGGYQEGTKGILDVAAAAPAVLPFLGRARRAPPVIGAFHGTGAPVDFTKFRAPPPTHDIGVHSTIEPYVSSHYSGDFDPSINFNKAKFIERPTDPAEAAGGRTMPVVLDIRNALRYPRDAIKWNVPENVIGPLETAMRSGFVAPRGLLSDMYNIAGSEKVWQRDFVPMLKERGYDSIFYPHAAADPRPKYNTFATLDPESTVARFTPEGQKLIAERGIREPIRQYWGHEPWSIPQGILKKPEEIETLVKDPKRNTAQWWTESAPPSKLKELDEKFTIEAERQKKAHAESQAVWKEIQVADKQKVNDFIKHYENMTGFKFPKGTKPPNIYEAQNFVENWHAPTAPGEFSHQDFWKYMNEINDKSGMNMSPKTLAGWMTQKSSSPAIVKKQFDDYVRIMGKGDVLQQYEVNNLLGSAPTLAPISGLLAKQQQYGTGLLTQPTKKYSAAAIDAEIAGAGQKQPTLLDDFGGSEVKLKKYWEKEVKNVSNMSWEDFLQKAKTNESEPWSKFQGKKEH
jgi:hypothetical protein